MICITSNVIFPSLSVSAEDLTQLMFETNEFYFEKHIISLHYILKHLLFFLKNLCIVCMLHLERHMTAGGVTVQSA